MTVYTVGFAMVSTNGGSTYNCALNLAIKANAYAIRVMEVRAASVGVATGTAVGSSILNRYDSSTISGGASLTPSAAHEASDPASATVLYQTGVWNGSTVTPGTAVSVSGTARKFDLIADEKWHPPADMTVRPGSTLTLSAHNPITPGIYYFLSVFQVWFDEEDVERSD